jgi:uncharacterized membrane-anchored protein YhcB (DUF1043 family)
MGVNIHIHHHYPEMGEIKILLKTIIQKLNTMPTKAEFDAAMAEITTAFSTQASALVNISDDITRLTEGLATGDLTPEEEAETFTALRSIADQAKSLATQAQAIADRTPEPPTS